MWKKAQPLQWGYSMAQVIRKQWVNCGLHTWFLGNVWHTVALRSFFVIVGFFLCDLADITLDVHWKWATVVHQRCITVCSSKYHKSEVSLCGSKPIEVNAHLGSMLYTGLSVLFSQQSRRGKIVLLYWNAGIWCLLNGLLHAVSEVIWRRKT